MREHTGTSPVPIVSLFYQRENRPSVDQTVSVHCVPEAGVSRFPEHSLTNPGGPLSSRSTSMLPHAVVSALLHLRAAAWPSATAWQSSQAARRRCCHRAWPHAQVRTSTPAPHASYKLRISSCT